MLILSARFLGRMIILLRIAPLLWVLRLRGRNAEADQIVVNKAVVWAQGILITLGVQVEITGLEHVPATGPLVVMSNHQSQFDIPLLMGHLGRMMGFVAKKELFRIPILSYWMRQIHCVPLERSNARAGGAALAKLGLKLERAGSGFIVFPEGTRTRDPQGRIGPFRQGSLRLASQRNLPVLPVTLDGTRFLSNPAALASTRNGQRLIRIRIDPLLYPSNDFSAPQRKQFMEDLRNLIVENWNQIKVDWLSGTETANPESAATPTAGK